MDGTVIITRITLARYDLPELCWQDIRVYSYVLIYEDWYLRSGGAALAGMHVMNSGEAQKFSGADIVLFQLKRNDGHKTPLSDIDFDFARHFLLFASHGLLWCRTHDVPIPNMRQSSLRPSIVTS